MTRTRRSSDQRFAGEGAVRQEGDLPIYVCNDCGRDVVWATSAKTGRRYLVTVTTGYLGQRFYVKANSHPRNCGELLAEQVAAEINPADTVRATFEAMANDPNETPEVRAKAASQLAKLA